jgi:UDP-N-acetyl-D-mannosaminuronic acid dehydrogenase
VTVDPTLVSLEEILATCDLLIVAAPHRVYRDLETDLIVADVWNLLGRGSAL